MMQQRATAGRIVARARDLRGRLLEHLLNRPVLRFQEQRGRAEAGGAPGAGCSLPPLLLQALVRRRQDLLGLALAGGADLLGLPVRLLERPVPLDVRLPLEELDQFRAHRRPLDLKPDQIFPYRKKAITNPKITSVSGMTSRTSIMPNISGRSATTPAAAPPILDWAIPVPTAPKPMAMPAPTPSRPAPMPAPAGWPAPCAAAAAANDAT